MEVLPTLTYTQLKSRLAEVLGRTEIPSSTLSRWMANLQYPKGSPGRRRFYDLEDFIAIGAHAEALAWGYTTEQAVNHAVSKVEKFRNGSQYRSNQKQAA